MGSKFNNFLLSLVSLPRFPSLAPGSGLTATPTYSPTALTQSYHIPRLAMHMISSGTGLPGNPPFTDAQRFNSTIDFDLELPSLLNAKDNANVAAPEPRTVNCQASFEDHTVPEGLIACYRDDGLDEDQVYFAMGLYVKPGNEGSDIRPELSFQLGIVKIVPGENENDEDTYFVGSRIITANDPREASSYLTCLQGAPLDGLRCNIKGSMSVRSELIINIMGFGWTDTVTPRAPRRGQAAGVEGSQHGEKMGAVWKA